MNIISTDYFNLKYFAVFCRLPQMPGDGERLLLRCFPQTKQDKKKGKKSLLKRLTKYI